ncbi:hypothetical protein D3C71_2097840 [compost metagenome]
MQLALPDTTPADGIEKLAIDQPTAGAKASGIVFINVIKRRAGIETGAHARLDAV